MTYPPSRSYKGLMDRFEDEQLPDELQDVVRRLKAGEPEIGALEVDELKRRVFREAPRASAPRFGKRSLMRSRLVTVLLVLAMALSGGAAGVIAGGGGPDKGSAAKSQYRP